MCQLCDGRCQFVPGMDKDKALLVYEDKSHNVHTVAIFIKTEDSIKVEEVRNPYFHNLAYKVAEELDAKLKESIAFTKFLESLCDLY